jgi:RNA polymerase sigma-70 factor (ECF subfamily)
MEDHEIIDLLYARDELGLQHTQRKYDPLYRAILRQLLTDKADVDECCNDVLLSVWNSIPPHFPDHFPSYICRIARRVGIDRFRHNTRQKRSGCTVLLSELQECIPAPNRLEVRLEATQLHQVLNHFLRELEPQTRVLFLRRYFYMESIKDLARRYEVSTNFVAVRLHRARIALRKLLEKEGIAV